MLSIPITEKSYTDHIPKLKLIDGNFHEKTRMGLYEKSNGRCAICGKKLSIEEMTVDHIKPMAAGGNNDMENYSAAVRHATLSRGTCYRENFILR